MATSRPSRITCTAIASGYARSAAPSTKLVSGVCSTPRSPRASASRRTRSRIVRSRWAVSSCGRSISSGIAAFQGCTSSRSTKPGSEPSRLAVIVVPERGEPTTKTSRSSLPRPRPRRAILTGAAPVEHGSSDSTRAHPRESTPRRSRRARRCAPRSPRAPHAGGGRRGPRRAAGRRPRPSSARSRRRGAGRPRPGRPGAPPVRA